MHVQLIAYTHAVAREDLVEFLLQLSNQHATRRIGGVVGGEGDFPTCLGFLTLAFRLNVI